MLISNKYHLPVEIVSAITQRKPEANIIHATEIPEPPIIRQLKMRYWDELEVDVSEQIFALHGIAVHDYLAKFQGENSVVEKQLEYDFGGYKISGRQDLFCEGKLTDYKNTSVWTIIFGDPKFGRRTWNEQLQIYKWLNKKHGMTVTEMNLICFLRDWHLSSWKKDPNKYPPVAIKVYDKIDIWEDVEPYLTERLALHKTAENLESDDLVECTPEEKWRTDTKYAVMKGSNKRAVRVFATRAEAELKVKESKAYWVEERLGKCVRCESYCPVSSHCRFNQQHVSNKETS